MFWIIFKNQIDQLQNHVNKTLFLENYQKLNQLSESRTLHSKRNKLKSTKVKFFKTIFFVKMSN